MSAFTRWLSALLVAAILCIVGAGAWFYKVQQDYVRQDIEPDLETIAQMKADQITRWRDERLGDAAVLTDSRSFAGEVAAWFAGQQPESADGILAKFRSLQSSYGYCDVLLVDSRGDVKLSVGEHPSLIHDEARQCVLTALSDGRPALTELHQGEIDQEPHVSAVAPIFEGEGSGRRPLGAVIMVVDASRFLYPLIQSWPTASESAETLLVRRDGDGVLFLNELRHRFNTALKSRVGLSETNVPAVMAVLGRTGVVYGVDYRGVPVVSVVRAVSNSPWFMVSKMDEAEAFAGWRFLSAVILASILGLMLVVVAVTGVVWFKQSREYYRELYRLETERHEAEVRYRTTLMSVGDAVIATDAEGRVRLLNPVAEALTGWLQDEARGKPLEAVFHIINEETRQVVENPVRRVVREGVIVGLANHTVLISRDGVERPIADSGSPIRDEQGVITGVVLVFRDVGKEQHYQRERETTLTLLRLLNDRNNTKDLIRSVTGYLQKWSGCEAVGVRLKEGDDYPYFETRGFPATFVEAENFLCERDLNGQVRRDSLGNPCLECMCGNILCGRFDPSKSFFTARGSFWSNCTTELLATTTPADRQTRTRNRCNGEGYESVALIRLQSGNETLGLLQFNDHAKGRFTPEILTFLENLADQIALALAERKAQASVRRNEAILNETGSIARIGGWEHDLVAGKATWTKALYDIFESESGELPGPNEHLNYYPPDDQARLAAAYQHAVETGKPFDLELQVFTAKKRTIWVNVIGRPVMENGKCVRMVGMLQDITERKQTEHDLEASETRYRRLFEAAKDGVLILDAGTGVIVDVNPYLVELLGFPREEFLGKHLWDIGLFKDIAASKASFEELGAREYVRYEGLPLETHDGRKIEVEFVSNVYHVDNTKVVQCNIRNITERKRAEADIRRLMEQGDKDRLALLGILEDARRAEEALRESERRFRSVVDAIPDLVWLKNPDGVYLACNRRFTQFFGAEEVKILGRTDYDFVDGKVADWFRDHDRKAMEAGGPTINEEWVTFAGDGHRELLETIKTPLYDTQGRVIGVLGVGRDITGRKKADDEIRRLNEELEQRVHDRTAQLEAANKELEAFSYSVSHDLRAPLRSIDGFSQAILEASGGDLSTETKANFERVRTAAQQMSRLIDGMLGLARLTRREMRRGSVDMSLVVDNLVQSLRKTDPGRRIHVEIAPHLVVNGDPDMLKIVVQNLIENAWKFTRNTADARIEFGVMEHSSAPTLQHSKTPVFFVRDNGAGFDPAYAGKLFGAFQRLHTEAEFSGTGLGLASVQRILLRHGGRIWAEGEVGKGATFYFTL